MMVVRISACVIAATLTLAAALPSFAQTRTSPPAAAAAAAQPAPAAPTKPAAVPARPAAQPVNVKIEVSLTDQRSGSEPLKRAISLIVADGESGSIRSEPVPGNRSDQLNVDARPTIVNGNKIRLGFSLQYDGRVPDAGTTGRSSLPAAAAANIRQSLSLILEDGKSLTVGQSADATSDRSVTVDVKATILK
jgi:hypothetical protein